MIFLFLSKFLINLLFDLLTNYPQYFQSKCPKCIMKEFLNRILIHQYQKICIQYQKVNDFKKLGNLSIH